MKNNEEEWQWPEVIMQLLTDDKFIGFLDRTTKTWKDVQDSRLDIERKRIDIESIKINEWKGVNKLFIVLRFILSLVTLIGLGLTLEGHLIPVELVVPLLAIVIGSLFVTPKKE